MPHSSAERQRASNRHTEEWHPVPVGNCICLRVGLLQIHWICWHGYTNANANALARRSKAEANAKTKAKAKANRKAHAKAGP